MKKHKECIAVVAPRRGMGDCVSFYGIFKTIYKVSGNKLILITHKKLLRKIFIKIIKYLKKLFI